MLNAAIDPRLELLSVVQLLGQYNSWYRLLERDPAHPYVKAVQSWFGPFRGHEAVRLSDELGRFGFSFNAPVALMKALGWAGGLSPGGAKAPGAPASEIPPAGGLSPVAPEASAGPLVVTGPLPPEVTERLRDPEAEIPAFVAALNRFAADSGFEEFFGGQTSFYASLSQAFGAAVAGRDLLADFLDYYGPRPGRFAVSLMALYWGNFGLRLGKPAEPVIDAVLGARSLGGDPAGLLGYYGPLLWHEWAHGLINPLVDAQPDFLRETEVLHAPVAMAMAEQAYSDWPIVVYEHLIRAATAQLVGRHFGPAAYERACATELKNHFVYLPPLLDALASYEADRARYPRFEDFFPQLMEVLRQEARRAVDSR